MRMSQIVSGQGFQPMLTNQDFTNLHESTAKQQCWADQVKLQLLFVIKAMKTNAHGVRQSSAF